MIGRTTWAGVSSLAASALTLPILLTACSESFPKADVMDGGLAEATASLPDGATSTDAGDADSAAADSAAPVADAAWDGGGPIAYDPTLAPPAGSFCSLPGSVVWTARGPMIMPGGDASTASVTWMQVPVGFCAHYFGSVPTARQLKFAPGGELFVASPTTGTTGGRGDGIAGIVVLPDDDHDGNADANLTFMNNLSSVQGLMFANQYFYYQDDVIIRRVPYRTGDRKPSGPSEVVANLSNWPQALEHWPKVFDQALDGTIYITNGGSQSDVCLPTEDVRGAIVKLNADGSTSEVAKGFRNPIAIRCESNHNQCMVVELALDYSDSQGGREKVMPVRQGDDWGYPCCATANLPYMGVTYQGTGTTPDCSGVAPESAAFIIGDTPFGIDFETGKWPGLWNGRAFVTVHGVVGTWQGARVVGIAVDSNGMLLPSTDIAGLDAGAPGNMLDFATGWDDNLQDHGRPAPIAFAGDGRMFVGDDQLGAVIWVAPVGLMP